MHRLLLRPTPPTLRKSLLHGCTLRSLIPSRRLTISHPSRSDSPILSQTVTKDGAVILRFENDPSELEEDITLEFVEEPCGLMAKQGFGYIQVEFGDRIGPDNRYEILRKFGWGMYSSVWLAKDTVDRRFVAIKVLKGDATRLLKKGLICELDVLRRISSQGHGMAETHCLTLLSDFIHPGKDGDGEHLCLVTDALGPSIGVFRNEKGRFTKPVIKKMLRDTLTGLAHLHSLGITHTDLRPENILMDLSSGSSAFDIESFIKEEPARRHPPERTWGNKFTQVAVSQPFPVPAFDDWISRSYVIGDFGSAQFVDKQVTDHITPDDLRAPETVLGLHWNEKVDIWTFGCLAFEFLADQKLMKTGREEWHPDRLLLFQMLVFTEDRLPAETVRSSKRAMEYLDPETGWLNDDTKRVKQDFFDIFKKIGSLQKQVDIDGAVGLLKKCIRLDPKDRYSAKELLEDPWLNTET